MQNRKKSLILFTILLLAIPALGIWLQNEDTEQKHSPFSVSIPSGNGIEQIRCWEKDPESYYVFLPSYADLSQAFLQIDPEYSVLVDGSALSDGMTCQDFPLNTPLEMTCSASHITYRSSLIFVQSANIPTLYIDVTSGSMEYIQRKRGNAEEGTLRLYTADNALDYSGYLSTIKGRGNSSWTIDKKPYSLTLAEEADLLGMGQASKWVLLSNAYDKTHLHNKIVYDFAQAWNMAYSPSCQWVDLYLNGEYNGLYLLSEKNEVHPQRVALTDAGGFLVSQEWKQNLMSKKVPYIETKAGIALRVFNSSVNTQELTGIWQSVENAILAEDGTDPVTGKHWTELIDLDSWVKVYLINELFGNIDTGFSSEYYYYDASDPSGKIYAGPVWDYDETMGKFPVNSIAHRPYTLIDASMPWPIALYQKPEFYSRLTELYQTEALPLIKDLQAEKLGCYRALINQAAQMDQLRWSAADPIESADEIAPYLSDRIAFLNSLWIEGETYCYVLADRGASYHSILHAVKPGECITNLFRYNENPDDFYWVNAETGEVFDDSSPIYTDMVISRRSRQP